MKGWEYMAVAADPKTKTCDWCGEPGFKALPIVKPRKKIGTGQFLYPCAKHVRTAESALEAVRKPKEAA